MTKGPVRSAQLNYNAEGKSKGVANVVYSRSGDAAKAVKEYNTRTFDGRPMKIELIISADAAVVSVPAVSRLGAPVQGSKTQGYFLLRGLIRLSARGANVRGRGGKSQRGRGGRRNNNGKPKTQEELDAELDGYMNDQVCVFFPEKILY